MSFIDEYCTGFDDEDEHKLEFTKIHNVSGTIHDLTIVSFLKDFKKIVEDLLQELMSELGVSD